MHSPFCLNLYFRWFQMYVPFNIASHAGQQCQNSPHIKRTQLLDILPYFVHAPLSANN